MNHVNLSMLALTPSGIALAQFALIELPTVDSFSKQTFRDDTYRNCSRNEHQPNEQREKNENLIRKNR